ncbi:aspartate/glutamate racemase family protein [Bacteroidota bacterium]
MKTVVAIHTAMPMVEPTKELFEEHLPDVRLINIVDDSLIQDVIKANEVTGSVKLRLYSYYKSALEAGADLIFNTCSSVGDIAIEAREVIDVPIVKIDDAMARKAVQSGSRIGVLATLQCTLDPTVRLLLSHAKSEGKKIEVVEGLAQGAFQAVIGGNREKHDALILEAALKIVSKVDVIVLAQGSMARMEKILTDKTGKLVLSSPMSGFLEVKSTLAKL